MNFFSATDTLTVGIGIFIGLIWSRKTGWSCGGVVTPGLLALYAHDWRGILGTLTLGILLSIPLKMLTQRWSLYGRERIGTAMLLALAARFFLGSVLFLNGHWIGWVIPGLIAADTDYQGIGMTLCGVLSCSVVTVFCVTFICGIWGLL